MDLALAHIRALDVIASQERLISNVGRGQGVSVRELVTTVEDAVGAKVNVVEKAIRPGDPPELVADNTFLKNLVQTRLQKRKGCGRRPCGAKRSG